MVALIFLAKSLKRKALLSHSIQILTIDFGCLIVKLSKLMFLTVSDVLLKMTTKNAHNPFCPRNLCINTSFSHIEKHLISEWNFPESYSDDYDLNGENFRKVCTEEGCNCTFDSFSELELHTDVGIHDTRKSGSLYDKVRKNWAEKFSSIENQKLTSIKSSTGLTVTSTNSRLSILTKVELAEFVFLRT